MRYRAWSNDLESWQAELTQFRDFLNRFRPAAAPGAARTAGVPADRAAGLAAEIEPALGLLAETHERCVAIAAEAERAAARIVSTAADRANAVTAAGMELANRTRQDAADEVIADAQARAAATLSAAVEAARSRGRPAEPAVDGLVQLAVRLVTSVDGAER